MLHATPAGSQRFAANIPRFFVFVALRGLQFGLITATWVIFLQQRHGLSLTQVTLIDVGFWIAGALGEVPTGVVADTIGRKVSLAIGSAVMGASMIAWSFAPSVLLVTIAYIMLAIGHTFLSGADEAFFYESLTLLGRTDEYAKLVGQRQALAVSCMAVGTLASGLLAAIDLRLPFLAAAGFLLGMFLITFAFHEPRHETSKESADAKDAVLSYGQIVRQATGLMMTRPRLRNITFYLILLGLTGVLMETVFLQPQALALGVPLAAVGAVVTVVHLMKILGSTAAHRVQKWVGDAKLLYASPWLMVVCLLGLAWYHSLPALVFVGLIGFLTNLARPAAMLRLQQQSQDNVRATILSLQALLFTLIVALIEPVMGIVADRFSLWAAYVVLATILGILLTLLLWKFKPADYGKIEQ